MLIMSIARRGNVAGTVGWWGASQSPKVRHKFGFDPLLRSYVAVILMRRSKVVGVSRAVRAMQIVTGVKLV